MSIQAGYMPGTTTGTVIGYTDDAVLIKGDLEEVLERLRSSPARTVTAEGLELAGLSVEALTYLAELAVFKLFIWEEILQVSCSQGLEYMIPPINRHQIVAHAITELSLFLKQAIGAYINYIPWCFYTKTGYRAYFNAVSIFYDVELMCDDRTPAYIVFR